MRPRTFTVHVDVAMTVQPFVPVLLLPVMVTLARAQDSDDVVGLPLGARPAPVVIEDLSGAAYDLGKWVGLTPMLLEFWATWCENCAALLPEMEAASGAPGRRFGGQGAEDGRPSGCRESDDSGFHEAVRIARSLLDQVPRLVDK